MYSVSRVRLMVVVQELQEQFSCARPKANKQAGKAGRLGGNNKPETWDEFTQQ